MDAQPLFFALAISLLALGAGLLARFIISRGSGSLPYKRVERLSRPSDPSLSGLVLECALGDDYYVLSNVNLVNLIQPREGLSNKEHAAALESVFDKQVDFAVCDHNSREIVGVIEMGSARRARKPRNRSDRFLRAALAAAGIPIAHVRARKAYALEEVRAEIMSALVPVGG